MTGDVVSLLGGCNVDPSRRSYVGGCTIALPSTLACISLVFHHLGSSVSRVTIFLASFIFFKPFAILSTRCSFEKKTKNSIQCSVACLVFPHS